MRIRLLAVVAALLVTAAGPAGAQRTGDRARLVFTISGAFIQSKGLWGIPSQPVQDPPLTDNLRLGRSIQSTISAGFSGTYYPGEHWGLKADAFLIGLGYEDTCSIVGGLQSSNTATVCEDIDGDERSSAAAVLSGGAIYRIASREFISPFVRASAGLLFSNQSSVLTQGFNNDGALVVIYDDEHRNRVSPAFAIGAGVSIPMGRGFGLRWEVRDNIVGIEKVTQATAGPRVEPPHERVYKNLFSVLVGIDVILERNRGRRY